MHSQPVMPRQEPSDFETEIISRIKETFGVPQENSVEVDDESLKNAGFCSTLKAVCLNGRFNVIIKCAPSGKKLRETIPFEKIFAREIYIYEVVFPIFKQIQREFGVEGPWESIPKCFHSSEIPFKEALVLEDLRTQGFALWARHQQMDGGHLKLVLGEYAKLHALSFALRLHKPKLLEEIKGNTEDVYLPIIKNCGTAATIRNLCGRVWKEFCGEPPNFDIVDLMEGLVSKSAAGKFAVLCHGDTCCNNILFKYKVCFQFTPLNCH